VLTALTAAPTAPAQAQACPPPSIKLAVFGDFGTDNASERTVAGAVKRWAPDYIVTTGDNSYSNGASKAVLEENIGKYYWEYIHPYTGAYATSLGAPMTPAGHNRMFPALGNHDWDGSDTLPQAYLDYFALPGNERYYSTVLGPIEVFVIDSDTREPDGVDANSAQAAWLRGAMAASRARWKLVFMHHPPYSGGDHGSSTKLRWNFQAMGAHAVFAGHDHHYERLDVNGTPYFVVGTGGAGLRDAAPLPETRKIITDVHGALRLEASDAQLKVSFADTSGAVLDTLSLGCGGQETAPVLPVGDKRVWIPAVRRR
jgi:tartrate-resistant acid phosphatase type 5